MARARPLDPVGIEVGVVDRELQAHRAAGGDSGAESHGQFGAAEAVRPRIIDGLHDRFVEHVGVDVDPEAAVRAVVAGQVGDGVAGRRGGAELTDPITVDDRHGFREWLAVAPVPVGGVAAGEHDHIVVADQRLPLLQVTHDVRAPAGDEGEIAGGRRSTVERVHLGLVEVGVAVDVQQPVAPAPPEREHRAQDDRAVTAQDDGELPRVQHFGYRVGQHAGVATKGAGVHDHGLRVAHRTGSPPRRPDPARRAPSPSASPKLSSDAGRPFHPPVLGNMAQRRRRLDDRVLRRHPSLPSLAPRMRGQPPQPAWSLAPLTRL